MTRALVVAVMLTGCGPARPPGVPAIGAPCMYEPKNCVEPKVLGMCVDGVWTEQACEFCQTTDPRCSFCTNRCAI